MDSSIWWNFEPLSSRIDWCETNYSASPRIAEFWNTISNLIFFVIPPLEIYLFNQYRKQVCGSVNVIWFLLMVVGAGSAYFHSTLSLVGQLIDEVAILWVNVAVVGIWIPTKLIPSVFGSDRRWFQAVIYTITAAVTVLSIIKPEINHVLLFSFGFPAFGYLYNEIKICECPNVCSVARRSAFTFVIAVVSWISDRFMCRIWIEVLHFPYLHSIWHVLICISAYLICVCFAYFYATNEAPEQCPTLKYWPHDSHNWFGVPYVALKVVGSKPTKSS